MMNFWVSKGRDLRISRGWFPCQPLGRTKQGSTDIEQILECIHHVQQHFSLRRRIHTRQPVRPLRLVQVRRDVQHQCSTRVSDRWEKLRQWLMGTESVVACIKRNAYTRYLRCGHASDISITAGRGIPAYKLAPVSHDPENSFPDRDMLSYFAEANHDVEHRLNGCYSVAILHHGFLRVELERSDDVLSGGWNTQVRGSFHHAVRS
jgi:hypothetical protein